MLVHGLLINFALNVRGLVGSESFSLTGTVVTKNDFQTHSDLSDIFYLQNEGGG